MSISENVACLIKRLFNVSYLDLKDTDFYEYIEEHFEKEMIALNKCPAAVVKDVITLCMVDAHKINNEPTKIHFANEYFCCDKLVFR